MHSVLGYTRWWPAQARETFWSHMVPILIILCRNSIVATYNFRVTFSVSWAFLTGSNSQAVDTESSQAPGLTHRFQGFMNVHRGTGVSAAVTVHRFVFLVFYIRCISKYNIHAHCITKFICRCIKIPTKYKKRRKKWTRIEPVGKPDREVALLPFLRCVEVKVIRKMC